MFIELFWHQFNLSHVQDENVPTLANIRQINDYGVAQVDIVEEICLLCNRGGRIAPHCIRKAPE